MQNPTPITKQSQETETLPGYKTPLHIPAKKLVGAKGSNTEPQPTASTPTAKPPRNIMREIRRKALQTHHAKPTHLSHQIFN